MCSATRKVGFFFLVILFLFIPGRRQLLPGPRSHVLVIPSPRALPNPFSQLLSASLLRRFLRSRSRKTPPPPGKSLILLILQLSAFPSPHAVSPWDALRSSSALILSD